MSSENISMTLKWQVYNLGRHNHDIKLTINISHKHAIASQLVFHYHCCNKMTENKALV